MIWIDLDNTLIFSPQWVDRIAGALAVSTNGAETQRLDQIPIAGTSVSACARPCAHRLLAELRTIAEVRLLTTATHAYAEAMNGHFGFGFAHAEITARESWMDFPGALRTQFRPKQQAVDPRGVLIDDDDESMNLRMKLLYLGTRSLITVRRFNGEREDPFASTWRECVDQTLYHVSAH